MICPVCEKGQMIKINKQNMRLTEANNIKCVQCSFILYYSSINNPLKKAS